MLTSRAAAAGMEWHNGLADPGLPSQPYQHEALELDLAGAGALVLEVRRAVSERARRALHALRNDLAPTFDLVALALREPRALPATLQRFSPLGLCTFDACVAWRDLALSEGINWGVQLVPGPV